MLNSDLLNRIGIKENFTKKVERKSYKESYLEIAVNYKKASISMENTNLKNSINEIITFKSGHSEGFGDKVKAGWDTFVQKIIKLWNDFIDGCQALIKKITGFFLKRKVEKVKKAYFQISHYKLADGDIKITGSKSMLDIIDSKSMMMNDSIINKVANGLRRAAGGLFFDVKILEERLDTIINNRRNPSVTNRTLEDSFNDFQENYKYLTEAVKKLGEEEKGELIVDKHNVGMVKACTKLVLEVLETQYEGFKTDLDNIDKTLTNNKEKINKLKDLGNSEKQAYAEEMKDLYNTIQKVQTEIISNIKKLSSEYSDFLNHVDIRPNVNKINEQTKSEKPKEKDGKRGSSANDEFLMSDM